MTETYAVCLHTNQSQSYLNHLIYIYIYIYIYTHTHTHIYTVSRTTAIQISGHDTPIMRKYIVYPGLIGGYSEAKNIYYLYII